MKKAGIIILIIGLAVTMVTGLSFVTRKKVIDIGKLEISANKNHSFSWSPVMGVIIMALGAGVYLAGTKKH
jgi:divalent metal cation (Fe/Co/Zn/Cd) transporter